MAYTAPTTRVTGDLITASIWNTDLVDSIAALKDPPSANYELDEGSDYTTTSTSFVDVDGTNLSLEIPTKGGDVLVGFCGSIANTAANIYWDVEVDGVRDGGDDGYCVSNMNHYSTISFVRLISGLAEGNHIFDLQWKVSGGTGKLYAGAGTTNYDVHPQFWAREIS